MRDTIGMHILAVLTDIKPAKKSLKIYLELCAKIVAMYGPGTDGNYYIS
jgi:hypothetical protein